MLRFADAARSRWPQYKCSDYRAPHEKVLLQYHMARAHVSAPASSWPDSYLEFLQGIGRLRAGTDLALTL